MANPGVSRERIASTATEDVDPAEHRAMSRTLLAAIEMAEAAGNEADARAIIGDALERLYEERMAAISESYFGDHWTAENAFSIWARLTDDKRAWGYGGEQEIAPLRWLVGVSDCWFDGQRMVPLDEWRACYEQWAAQQEALVRRMTPGALGPGLLPPSMLPD
jgi:hypothetical protein